MNRMKVIISGGGTGGHIFPAIAIANAIKERYPQSDVLFVGANDRMEMQKVPEAGYEIVGLDVAGFNRKQLWKNVSVLWRVYKSMRLAKQIIKKFHPDIAIGVGGYASGPTLQKAASLGIPTLLQEQNSYAGITNKLLAKKAKTICVAYEGMEAFFPKEKIVMTGNPCRQDLLNESITREEAAAHFNLDPKKKTILVIGGSLGSRTINQSMFNGLEQFGENDIQVIWQCGAGYLFDLNIEMTHKKKISTARIVDFISRMDYAYKAADLVISRAGASSISELCLLGKPTILIPSPNVAEDHQTQNALALVKKNAAILIADKDADAQLIGTSIETILSDSKLKTLSANISKLAQHNSANRIVDEAVKIIEARRR